MMLNEYLRDIEPAGQIALARRREAGEVMTYTRTGGRCGSILAARIERLAPIGTFRAEDFPIEP